VPDERRHSSIPLTLRQRVPALVRILAPALAVLLVGLAVTHIAVRSVRHREAALARADFERVAAMLSAQVAGDLARHAEALAFTVKFFAGSEEVTREEFVTFFGEALDALPGFYGAAYLPATAGPQAEPAAQAFQLWAQDAGERVHVDLTRAPNLSVVLDAATNAGELVAGTVSAAGEDPLTVLVQPIPAADTAGATTGATSTAGHIIAAFGFEPILTALGRHEIPVGVDLHVLTAQSQDPALAPLEGDHGVRGISARGAPPEQTPAEFSARHETDFAGRRWVIACHAHGAYLGGQASYAAWGTGLGGILVTLLLAAYVATLRGRSAQVCRQVELRTTELRASNANLAREVRQRRRVEQTLKDSRAFLQSVIDAVPDAMTVIDGDYRIVLANRAATEVIGRDPVSAELTCHQALYAREQPCAESGQACPVDAVRAVGKPITVELTLTHGELGERQIEATAAPIHNTADEIREVVQSVRDVTEQRRNNERFVELKLLNERLLEPGTLAEKLERVTAGIVSIFDADFARIWTVEAGDRCERGCVHARAQEETHACRDRDQCLHLIASSGRYTHRDGELHRRVPLGSYKVGCLASSAEASFLSNDVGHDARIHNRAWARELGLQAFAGFRLTSPSGAPLGVLAMFSRQKISPQEEALLATLANTTAHVIQTALTEQRLLEEKHFSDTTIDSLPGLFYLVDEQGRFRRWNRNLLRLSGCDEAELATLGPLDFTAPEDQERVRAEIGRAFTEGQAAVVVDLVTRDGRRTPFLQSGRQLKLAGECFMLGTGIDISEQKRVEEELERRVAELSEAKRRLEVLVADTAGREKRMVALKGEVNELLAARGEPAKYQAPEQVARFKQDRPSRAA